MPRKPKKIYVEPLIARPIKPPTKTRLQWYWRVEVHREGETTTVWSGRSDREPLSQYMAKLAMSGAWAAPPEGEDGEEVVTIQHLLRAWFYDVEQRKDLARSSVSAYRAHRRRLEARLADVLIDTIDLRTLERYRDEQLGAGCATSTVSQDLRVLQIAWGWGFRRGATSTERLQLPSILVTPKRTRHMPDRQDAWAVIQKADGYIRTALHVQWAYGCRVSECTSIQPRDLDLERGRFRLISRIDTNRTGKTGERWVPLVPAVRELLVPLAEGLESDAWILGVKPITARQRVISDLPKLCFAAEVERFTSHGLRHAMINAMLDRGIDVKTIAAWSGNTPATIWKTYARAGGANLEAAAMAVRAGERPRPEDRKVLNFPHGSPAQLPEDLD